MSWIKRVLKKIFYKEPNAKKQSGPIIVNTKLENFDFKKWSGLFSDLSHWEKNFKIDEYNCPILLNKCTDGISFLDNTHAPRKEACKKKGVLYSGYHFYEVGYGPIAQAEFYVKSHGEFEINPIVDYETNKSQNDSDLKKAKENLYLFLLRVEALTGKTPIIYTGLALCKFLSFDQKFARFPLWIAAYRSVSNPPACPAPWSSYFSWQYSESEKIPGCGPSSDANIYNKKMDLFNLEKK